MAKKLICFPFISGSLQEWSLYNLGDNERKRVYDGELVQTEQYGSTVVWKPNEEVELTLTYEGYGRGRSAVTFYWKDENDNEYPMFLKDFDELLKKEIGINKVHGVFTYVKRGANYGIQYLKKVGE